MRDRRIDWLKFLGLSLIVLAHTGPPPWLFQLRNFDVPLMVMVSGLALAQRGMRESWAGYAAKRAKRLVLPTWAFLTGYFIFLGASGRLPAAETIADSYLFRGGIGYVWIVRVFLIVALAAPGLVALDKGVRRNWVFLGILAGCYLILRGLLALGWTGWTAGYFYDGLVFSLVAAVGIRLKKLSPLEIGACGLACAGTFAAIAASQWLSSGQFVPTQTAKYPPTTYYLAYAGAASLAAWVLARPAARFLEKAKPAAAFVYFAAENSLWIYLWHIPFVDISVQLGLWSCVPRYLFVYSAALSIVWVQTRAVERSRLPRAWKAFFTG